MVQNHRPVLFSSTFEPRLERLPVALGLRYGSFRPPFGEPKTSPDTGNVRFLALLDFDVPPIQNTSFGLAGGAKGDEKSLKKYLQKEIHRHKTIYTHETYWTIY